MSTASSALDSSKASGAPTLRTVALLMITPNQSIVHDGRLTLAPLCQKTPPFKVPVYLFMTAMFIVDLQIRWQSSFRGNLHPEIVCGAGFDPDAKTKKPSSGSSVAKSDVEDNSSQATKSSTELDDSEIEARLVLKIQESFSILNSLCDA